MIINEFININEKNNSLSPQIIEHKKSITYGVANQIVAWDCHTNEVALNRLAGSKPSNSLNWISSDNTDIDKQ